MARQRRTGGGQNVERLYRCLQELIDAADRAARVMVYRHVKGSAMIYVPASMADSMVDRYVVELPRHRVVIIVQEKEGDGTRQPQETS